VLGVLVKESHDGSENKALKKILANSLHEVAINNLHEELDLENLLPDEKSTITGVTTVH